MLRRSNGAVVGETEICDAGTENTWRAKSWFTKTTGKGQIRMRAIPIRRMVLREEDREVLLGHVGRA